MLKTFLPAGYNLFMAKYFLLFMVFSCKDVDIENKCIIWPDNPLYTEKGGRVPEIATSYVNIFKRLNIWHITYM